MNLGDFVQGQIDEDDAQHAPVFSVGASYGVRQTFEPTDNQQRCAAQKEHDSREPGGNAALLIEVEQAPGQAVNKADAAAQLQREVQHEDNAYRDDERANKGFSVDSNHPHSICPNAPLNAADVALGTKNARARTRAL